MSQFDAVLAYATAIYSCQFSFLLYGNSRPFKKWEKGVFSSHLLDRSFSHVQRFSELEWCNCLNRPNYGLSFYAFRLLVNLVDSISFIKVLAELFEPEVRLSLLK